MSEPAEMIAQDARRKADQALLLARVFATAVTLVVGLSCLLAGPIAIKFEIMFAELGVELPVISRLIVDFPALWMIGLLVLTGVTLFFIWAKGRTSAWMAGMGLLLLVLALPVVLLALFLPLMKIITEMGNL